MKAKKGQICGKIKKNLSPEKKQINMLRRNVNMTYKVRIEVGKGKNHAVTERIPLPNKKRVCNYIKRSPLVKSNTKIKVTNLRTKKITFGTQSTFCVRGRY